MLLIESIRVHEVARDSVKLKHFESGVPIYTPGSATEPPGRFTHEMVQGRIFAYPDGRKVCVGMSKQVQEAINLPFEVFSNMRIEMDSMRSLSHTERQWAKMLKGDLEKKIETLAKYKRCAEDAVVLVGSTAIGTFLAFLVIVGTSL